MFQKIIDLFHFFKSECSDMDLMLKLYATCFKLKVMSHFFSSVRCGIVIFGDLSCALNCTVRHRSVTVH